VDVKLEMVFFRGRKLHC